MPEFQPRYPGHEPLPYRDELDRLMETRFDISSEVRTEPSTRLAPPPADEPKQDFRHSLKTESPTKKPRPGFAINGFDQRRVERERRKREALPEQIPQDQCPHGQNGFARDGRATSGRRFTGEVRLKCRACGWRLFVSQEQADRIMDGGSWREVTAA